MSIIKQIAVYNGTTWETDDIGTDATKVSTTAVTGQNSVEGALTALKNASNIGLNPNVLGQNNVQSALNQISGKIGSADISTIGSDITSAITSLNARIDSVTTNTSAALDNKVSKSGDTMTGALEFIDTNQFEAAAVSVLDDTINNRSGIVLQGRREISNDIKSQVLKIGVDNQSEPYVLIQGVNLNETNITVDTAWRNAIKAFGKYGDEEHYGSMFIQPTPNDPDVTADLSQGVTDRNWSGIAFRDKNDQEMSLVRGYSRAKTSSANSITGFQIDSRYRNWGSSNALIGRNILEIGVDEIGNPIVNIQAVGATAADNRTSYARAAWRKAITGSSKIASVMSVSFQTVTLSSAENFPANDTTTISLTANAPNDPNYDWTDAIAVQGWTHSHQNKLLVLNYMNTSVQNNQCTVNATIQNPTSNSLQDLVSFRLIWFAVFKGTNNV